MSKYPFRFGNFKHQSREFRKYRNKRARFLAWTMRTGKTKAMIDLACYAREKYNIDGVLVFAPNGVHETWVEEALPDHHWERVKFDAIAWETEMASISDRDSKPAKIRKAEWQNRLSETIKHSPNLVWFTVGSDSMIHPAARKAINLFRLKRKKFLVIFDEAHDFRQPGAKRTKMARAISKKAMIVRNLSGTSTLNNPLHAYSQYGLLKDKFFGRKTFQSFKKKYATYVTQHKRNGDKYPKLEGFKNLEDLRDRMAKATSYVRREDCEDLPPTTTVNRYVEMTDKQQRIYDRTLREFLIDIEKGGEVSVGENTMRMIKLQQVLSGYLIDEYGDVHDVVDRDHNPRIKALMSEITFTPGKSIVWCQYRQDIKRVAEALRELQIGFVEYHGGVSRAQRKINRKEFKTSKYANVFLGQPAAGGVGLNLTPATDMFHYSHTWNSIIRLQSDERATVTGGISVGITNLVMRDTVDEYILERIRKNVNVFDFLEGRKPFLELQDLRR